MMKSPILKPLLLCLAVIFFHHSSVNAHNFYDNNDSVLFTLVKYFETENNLASNNFETNSTSSAQHSQNADRLLKQINFLKSDLQTDSNSIEQSNKVFNKLNLTTKALVAANLADESVKQYGIAYGLDNETASDLLNMSMGMIMSMPMSSMNMTDGISAQGIDKTNYSLRNTTKANHITRLIDNDTNSQISYESSLMLTKSLRNIFSNYLQNVTLNNSAGLMPIPVEMKKVAVEDLSKGIENLLTAVTENRSLEEVFSILHGQIHPNLFLAYDLKLKAE